MSHKKHLDELKKVNEKDLPKALKTYLAKCEKDLEKIHRQSRTSGVAVCRAYTAVIDDVLSYIYDLKKNSTGFNERAALVAVGGYGRGELNIRSDIDLILLHQKEVSPSLKAFTEAILYLLYDTGLDLGFTIRTPDECISLAKTDLNTMTSLMETRFLRGDENLYRESFAAIKKKLFTKRRISAFIEDKIAETQMRYARYGASVFILEPNVKEGEGGLRDLHSARWILMARDGVYDRPFSLEIISESNKQALDRGLAFLLWVRNELHFESSKKTDQLTFDHQVRIAPLLGFRDSENALGVEAFMQEYYKHTSDIHNAYEHIVSRHEHEKRRTSRLWPAGKKRLDENFYISKGWLTLNNKRELTLTVIIKAFEYLSTESLNLDQRTKDDFIEYIHQGREGDFAISEEAIKSFFAVLRSEAPYEALFTMHSIGLLALFIPEFGHVRHKTQHDLYHVYTVDTHTLFALRELERLREMYSEELPTLSALYRALPDRAPIVLATLLHDIGKAFGENHAKRGAALVPLILGRLAAESEMTELVQFLVENHLLLANTALYRDIHDDKLISEFTAGIENKERLDALYLLTFADVRSVGPEVWSKWKGMLFDELYHRAAHVIKTGTTGIELSAERVRRVKRDLKGLIGAKGSALSDSLAFLELLPERYFLVNNEESILEQLAVLATFKGARSHVLEIKKDPTEAYTSLIICSLDKSALFAMISGVMAGNGIDILGAQITTLKNGLVLDVLQVCDSNEAAAIDVFKQKKIDKDLGDVISGKVAVEKLIRRKPSILEGRHKTEPVGTRVAIDNKVSETMSLIEIHAENKLGLLYDITTAISELGLYINIARISTKGSEATDVFYVKDIFGQKVYDRDKLSRITTTLYEAIDNKKASDDNQKKV